MQTLPAVCPNCRAALDIANHQIHCDECGARYASPFGVPILVSGAVVERVAPPMDSFVEEIASGLGAADAQEDIKECFSLRLKMPQPAMQVEADQFAHRLRASGLAISNLSNPPFVSSQSPKNIVDQIRVQLAPLIFPKAFAAGQTTTINVRISNDGACVLSSRHEPPFYMSYFWRHAADGIGIEGQRTHLLIDLPPGRAITQPIVIEAPINPGDYILEITPLLEHVSWLSEFHSSSHVTVSENVAPQSFTHKLEEPPPTYFERHIRGADLLSKWIDVHIRAQTPFVLEIGGNYSPATERLHGCVVVNLDVDAHGLMTRNIVKSDGIKSLVADGMDIPFADHCFDVITMFATFHHFPDPILLLRHLSTKVKPSGLICLMCEPIGHVRVEHNYKEYIDELEKGVYEQSFEIWEYVAMSEAAELEVVEAVFESGAAMVALRPKK